MNIVEGNPFFTNISNKIQTPYLDKDIKTDIVIIGCGITSLITAYFLSKTNKKIVILEKDRIAYKSTSITTSLLQYELDDNFNTLRKYYTKEELKVIYLECSNALYQLEDICCEIDCIYKPCNCLLYSNKDVDYKDILDEYQFRKEIGLEVKLVKDYSDEIKHGVLSFNGGISFNPYEFCIKMCKYLISNNVFIYENSEVNEILYDKNILVTKYNYKVYYSKVIVATGYDLSLINKNIGKLSYTYNIVTNETNIDSHLLIRDNKEVYNYYRVHNKRIIAGGYDTPNYNNKQAEEIYDKLLSDIKKIYNVSNLKIDYKYSGLFNSTKDNLGYFGNSDKKDVLYALGYGANGIVFAVIGANIIVDDINNKDNKNKKYFNVLR